MKVKEAMSTHVEALSPSTPVIEAAKRMRDLDCGFVPVSDTSGDKLQGVVTDRDITIRAVAEGLSTEQTPVEKVLSSKVLYCFQDDAIEAAADSMAHQHVYRLVVLDNEDSKQMVGIISLGDILRHDHDDLGGRVAHEICAAAA